MNHFRQEIKEEQKRVQRLVDLATPVLPLHESDAARPRGSLSLLKRGEKTYCYEILQAAGKPRRKLYLGSPQSPQVKELIDTKMREEKLRRLHEDSLLLQNLDRRYLDYGFDAVRDALPRTYRQLATSDNFNQLYEEIKQWAAADYERNQAPFSEAEIYAKDGRRMRSKGECIIYNIFYDLQLPIRYDSVLTITDRDGRFKKVSPDFLIQCLSGSFIIIEHLGWYSGMKYGLDFGEKCYWYLQAGYVLGKNFFVTSDDARGGTDSQAITEVIRQVERKFYGY